MEPASADSTSQPTPPVSNTEEQHSNKVSGKIRNVKTEEHHSTQVSGQIDNAQTEEHHSTEVSGQIANAQTEEHLSTEVSQQIGNAQTEEHHSSKVSGQIGNAQDSPSLSPTSGISSWARNLKLPQVLGLGAAQKDLQTENTSMSAFARLTGGLGMRKSSNETAAPANSGAEQSNLIESFTKGLMDSSKTAVKAVQVKARHIVSQNKRRYQVR